MKRKNILLLFTDQQRYDTIEALGNKSIRTPTLNWLAENGVAFERAYTPCPVCVPARYSMLSGQLPHVTGCADNDMMPDGRNSIMEILSRAEYQTHGVGKMHFTFKGEGDMSLWGFESRDTSEEVSGARRDDYINHLRDNGYAHVRDPLGVRSEMYYIPQPSQLPERLHNSAWVADKSMDFLKGRDKDRPFFMMTSFIKPHPPFESPVPWNKLYRGPELPLPKRPQDREELITYWNHFQNRYKYRDQGIDDNLVRTMKAAYYSAVSFIDYQLGRLLDFMRQQGLMDDTLILFTSDHGELLGDYDCFGKRSFLDSAARVPLLMYGGDIGCGKRCDTPVSLVDIFPTLLQTAGLSHPEGTERCAGESLYDIVQGGAKRDMVTGQFSSGASGLYMAVDKSYKYIYSAPDKKEYLFDLDTDPQETRNKAHNIMFRDTVSRMRGKLIAYYQGEGYTLPLENGAWRDYGIQAIPSDPDWGLLFQDPADSLPDIPGYAARR
ncbi:MAG: sulfatase [Eubacteriales bacterium]